MSIYWSHQWLEKLEMAEIIKQNIKYLCMQLNFATCYIENSHIFFKSLWNFFFSSNIYIYPYWLDNFYLHCHTFSLHGICSGAQGLSSNRSPYRSTESSTCWTSMSNITRTSVIKSRAHSNLYHCVLFLVWERMNFSISSIMVNILYM